MGATVAVADARLASVTMLSGTVARMGRDVAELVDALRADPSRTAVLLDFDGTLAPIVDDPAASVPLPGVVAALDELCQAYAQVAVISGRPVAFLTAHLPAALTLAGLYGLERVVDGEVVTRPEAVPWRSIVDEVADRALRELPATVVVEHKGLSITLHVRTDPAAAALVQEWATAEVDRSGLEVRRARMSVELHPSVSADKGTVVAELLESVEVACFIGDDVGDVPAFDALDAFAARGGSAIRFVVLSSELEPTLAARADALLDGPGAVLSLLRDLRS